MAKPDMLRVLSLSFTRGDSRTHACVKTSLTAGCIRRSSWMNLSLFVISISFHPGLCSLAPNQLIHPCFDAPVVLLHDAIASVGRAMPAMPGGVGRVSTRHVGLKPDLQRFAHKCRQECNTTLTGFMPATPASVSPAATP